MESIYNNMIKSISSSIYINKPSYTMCETNNYGYPSIKNESNKFV